ncbi:hypothetical protein M405DRAFT_834244, partial [Rhizopogon salebrosus TDB-379]
PDTVKTMSTSCLFRMQVSTWRLCYLIDNVCPYAPRHDQKCYTSSTLSNTKNPVASLLSMPLILTSHPTSRSTTSPAPNNVYQRCPSQK